MMACGTVRNSLLERSVSQCNHGDSLTALRSEPDWIARCVRNGRSLLPTPPDALCAQFDSGLHEARDRIYVDLTPDSDDAFSYPEIICGPIEYIPLKSLGSSPWNRAAKLWAARREESWPQPTTTD
jgi:hypothetical protein